MSTRNKQNLKRYHVIVEFYMKQSSRLIFNVHIDSRRLAHGGESDNIFIEIETDLPPIENFQKIG